MALVEGAKGAHAISGIGTEDNLFSSATGLKYYQLYLNTNAMVAGDILELRTFVNDPQSAVERLYDLTTYSGVQPQPVKFVPPLPTDSFRVTVKQTAGTARTFNWVRYES